MAADEPEQPRRRRGQAPVRPGEDRLYVGAGVPGVERVQQPCRVAQFGGEGGQRERGVRGAPGGEHRQRQRQPRAVFDHLVHDLRLDRQPVRAEAAGQQLPGLGGAEQPDGDRAGALGGDQAGEPVAAGDQDRQPGLPGSRGRSCSTSRALSSSTRIRRSASRLR